MGTSFSSLSRLRRTTSIDDWHVESAYVARYTTGLRSRLFALIIGIDNYPNCDPLRGAVADAKEMKRYLQETLGVSEGYIRILLDDQATRAAIIAAFQHIRNDSLIQKGDPILIYFAGHGAELNAPTIWGIKSMIQAILPHNYKRGMIHPILDRTIGVLIDDIAREKGDNITVIFDCCHAAGGTRIDDSDSEYLPRTPRNIDPDILLNVDDLDQDILTGRHGEVPEGFGTHGAESHTLLAACRTRERAYEYRRRGLFTSGLLEVLRGSSVNHLTYAEVIDRIHLDRPDQTPCCLGAHERRVLFNERVADDGPIRYPIEIGRNDFVIRAGLAHCISAGMEFALYSERGQRLDTIKVDSRATIQDFKTTFRMRLLSNAQFAKLTSVGKVAIYVTPERNSRTLKKNLRKICQSNDVDFHLVENPGEAKLEVAMKSGYVCFKILDPWTKSFGLTRLPSIMATPETVQRVLSAAAHYYWYLYHCASRGVNNNLKVDCHELRSILDDEGRTIRVPTGKGLCRKVSKDDDSHVISLVAAREKAYGIEISNNTQRDLYVNAFLFNSSSFCIVPYHIQSTVGNPEAPLKKKGTLTIGYHSNLLRYWLLEGQDADMGFLKLFFATRPIDLSSIIQGSPFQPDEQSGTRRFGDAREGCAVTDEPNPESLRELEDIWFTKVIPILQMRNARVASRA